MKVKTLDNNPVVTEVRNTMNVTKGTVHSKTLGQSTEEEILNKLKDQAVIKVERMKRLEEYLVANLQLIGILTFNTTYLSQ